MRDWEQGTGSMRDLEQWDLKLRILKPSAENISKL